MDFFLTILKKLVVGILLLAAWVIISFLIWAFINWIDIPWMFALVALAVIGYLIGDAILEKDDDDDDEELETT